MEDFRKMWHGEQQRKNLSKLWCLDPGTRGGGSRWAPWTQEGPDLRLGAHGEETAGVQGGGRTGREQQWGSPWPPRGQPDTAQAEVTGTEAGSPLIFTLSRWVCRLGQRLGDRRIAVCKVVRLVGVLLSCHFLISFHCPVLLPLK